MEFYTGKSKDGSDMKKVLGMYISLDGNQWSSEPYSHHKIIDEHLKKYARTIDQEMDLIMTKKSILPATIRLYLLKEKLKNNYKNYV